jgi:hypothetical protein
MNDRAVLRLRLVYVRAVIMGMVFGARGRATSRVPRACA